MKRKKFVKQCMGLYPYQSRNDANTMAKYSQTTGKTYAHGLERYKGILCVMAMLPAGNTFPARRWRK